MFAIVFAAKSNTSESDWHKIMSGDKSILTANETQQIATATQTTTDDNWWLLKKLAKLRMNADNANHVENILEKLNKGTTVYRISDGLVG